MGSILLSVKDFSDDELILNEKETILVLKFFWPSLTNQIDGIRIDNDARRLAQTVLIAGIDGSYAMGFVNSIFLATTRPGSGIKDIAKRFARGSIKHHFKHADIHDLEDVKIYETIRRELARQLRNRLDNLLNGLSLSRAPLFIYVNTSAAA